MHTADAPIAESWGPFWPMTGRARPVAQGHVPLVLASGRADGACPHRQAPWLTAKRCRPQAPRSATVLGEAYGCNHPRCRQQSRPYAIPPGLGHRCYPCRLHSCSRSIHSGPKRIVAMGCWHQVIRDLDARLWKSEKLRFSGGVSPRKNR
jgi:hypothetical protein